MKKFYKKVSVSKDKVKGKNNFSVKLDDKIIQTPTGIKINVSSEALANAIADEWRDQGDKVDIKSMLLTTMCYAAIDQGEDNRAMIEAEVAAYADTDLICYRAEIPQELRDIEAQAWDPIVALLEKEYSIKLIVTNGIGHVEQATATHVFVKDYLAKQDIFSLIALQMITSLLGSIFLIVAVAENKLRLDEAWSASRIDEDFQASRWGEDDEAKTETDAKYKQYSSAVRFLFLSKSEKN